MLNKIKKITYLDVINFEVVVMGIATFIIYTISEFN